MHLLEMAVVATLSLTGLGLAAVWLRSSLTRGLSDKLSESMSKASLELKESMADRLGRHFLESQERVDRTLGQNRLELHAGLGKSTQALEQRFQSLESQIGTRLETIGKSVESKLNENLKEGFRHFEKVQHHLAAAEQQLAQLGTVGQSISDLNHLLRLPHLRGSFGEASLERLLADFLPAASYELQYAVAPGQPERVDAVVRLARQVLPIDSKFPREQVLPLFDSQEPQALEAARKALGEFIRAQARTIAEKYIRPEHGTTEMALLYLPSETLYFEVIRDGATFEAMAKRKVFPASPNTLAITLHSISVAQEYYEMSRGVERTIEDLRKARRHFEHFEGKFEDIGRGLRKAQEAFETANTHLGHYESSIFRLTGDALERLPSPPPAAPGPAPAAE
jgi:DNA recombination protein RmuC